MDDMGIAAIVLAAGASRRMGAPKALLRYRERTFVEAVVGALATAGAHPVAVVTRSELADAVREAVGERATVVLNPDPDRGMLSSIQAALRALPEGPVLVALVDQPDIAPATVATLIDAHRRHPDRIVIPVRDGHRGHPVVFPAACRAELLATPDGDGARAVVRRDPDRVLTVPVDDAAAFLDVDHGADLRRLSP